MTLLVISHRRADLKRQMRVLRHLRIARRKANQKLAEVLSAGVEQGIVHRGDANQIPLRSGVHIEHQHKGDVVMESFDRARFTFIRLRQILCPASF